MAENSKIEWLNGGSTWNFMDAVNIETGKVGFFCEKIAPECKLCYAEKMNVNTYFGNGIRYAVDQRGKVRITLNERKLQKPLHWRKPRLIFPCSMTDLFGAWVPDEWIDAAYDVMEKASQHTFLVLTKRPVRRMAYLRKRYANRPPAPNIWEGTSCGLQETADEFIPLLLQTPAAVRWISAEPLLGAVRLDDLPIPQTVIDASPVVERGGEFRFNALTTNDDEHYFNIHPKLDWVVAGGESGPNARPMNPDWARSLRDQCKAAGVPFFFKQWGEWAPGECADTLPTRTEEVATYFADTWNFSTLTPKQSEETHRDDQPDVYRLGKKAAGRKLDGVEHNEYPLSAGAAAGGESRQ